MGEGAGHITLDAAHEAFTAKQADTRSGVAAGFGYTAAAADVHLEDGKTLELARVGSATFLAEAGTVSAEFGGAGDRSWRRLRRGSQQVPSFEILRIFLTLPGGIKKDHMGMARQDRRGDDVPGIFEDEVDGEEIDFAADIGLSGLAENAYVAPAMPAISRGFDLYPHETPVAFEGEVVAGGVTPRMADAKSEFGGDGHESQLCPLATQVTLFNENRFSFPFHKNDSPNKNAALAGRVVF